MNLLIVASVLTGALCSCTTPPIFDSILNDHPEQIWDVPTSSETYRSYQAYRSREKLPNGLTYGDSVRGLDLSRLCTEQIQSWAIKQGCETKDDVLKDPKQNLPLHDSNGQTIPLVFYLCPDGGVIRMKPKGDPTNPKETQPSVVKAMRYFGSDRYDNFGDEAFKVDNQGRAVPKWEKDMSIRARTRYIEEWAHDSHTPLKPCL